MWGAVKDKCYAEKPETIYALKDNIREDVGEIQLHTIDTYIIGHYNPSVRIIELAFRTTCGVCVHFIYKWRDLQFKVDSERQIHDNFIYSQNFCQKSAERKSHEEIHFFNFILMFGLMLEPRLYV